MNNGIKGKYRAGIVLYDGVFEEERRKGNINEEKI